MIFRYASSGIFACLGIIILRDYGLRVPAVLGALSSFSAAGYTICTHIWFSSDARVLFYVIEPFCVMGPVHIWLFSLSQFRDHFRITAPLWVFGAMYLLLNRLYFDFYYGSESIVGDAIFAVYSVLRFGLIAHMLLVAWQGRADDLLEVRRRFRTIFVILVGAALFIIFVAETFFTPAELKQPEVLIGQSTAFLLLAFTIMWHATKLQSGILLVRESREIPLQKAQRGEGLDPADELDLAALRKAVVEEQGFLEPSLTISKLAERVASPEHRLRRLINQHLGYRNFADFLNHYRIAEAQRLLADPSKRHTQILTIAMDLGYGSLGPFNRAFKERTGRTPTEYRRAALAYADDRD